MSTSPCKFPPATFVVGVPLWYVCVGVRRPRVLCGVGLDHSWYSYRVWNHDEGSAVRSEGNTRTLYYTSAWADVPITGKETTSL